jgi:hypothetical protein
LLKTRFSFCRSGHRSETGASVTGVRIETGMAESPVIPVGFHEAIVHLAVAHGYEKKLVKWNKLNIF